jgi:hypothetical protein
MAVTHKTRKHKASKKTSTHEASGKSTHENMHETCMLCMKNGRKTKVNIKNLKVIEFKGKGGKTRRRLAGVCEHSHKWSRFIKSA